MVDNSRYQVSTTDQEKLGIENEDDGGENDQAEKGREKAGQLLYGGGRAFSLRQPLHPGLHGLQVDNVDQCDVGDECQQRGVLDHLQVRDPDVFHHQERHRSHDGRGQLAVGGGRHFHRPGFLRGETHLAHQGNREGPGGDHVGDGRPGNQAGHARGHHGGLRRPALQMSHEGKGYADEVIAGPSLLQQGSEQYEQKHHARRHAQGHAEYALGGQIVM